MTLVQKTVLKRHCSTALHKNTSLKGTSTKDASPEGTAPKDTAPKDIAPKDIAPKGTALKALLQRLYTNETALNHFSKGGVS
jgi:hypothetical protein